MSFVTVMRCKGTVEKGVVKKGICLSFVVDENFEGVDHFFVVREEDGRREIGRSYRCYWGVL